MFDNYYVIEAKRRGWKIDEIKISFYKIMTLEGPSKIKSLILEIFIPSDIDSHRFKVLQNIAEECPVKLNLEDSGDIELNWHQ